jgi:indolepyruvate ferredoxin oxidoreductase beta subunit
VSERGRALDERVRNEFPAHVHGIIVEGVRRLMDYQDAEYAELYLKRLGEVRRSDDEAGGMRHGFALSATAARQLALWMSYEDTIRVADLKTRSRRFERFRGEVRAAPGQIVYVTEFMHPRFQELCETLPAGLGRWLERSKGGARLLAPLFRRGRHFNTAKLSGFLPLYLLAGMRRWRRATLRYRIEQARIESWLERIRACAAEYELAVEIAECQRLIKGYGDTHARGLKSYESIMQFVERGRGRAGLAVEVRRLRSAALADENGRELDTAMRDLAA